MCHFGNVSAMKKSKTATLHGSITGLVTLQQVYQHGMVFEADVDIIKSSQKMRGK